MQKKQKAPSSKSIEAEKFVLKNAKGNSSASLELSPEGAVCLTLEGKGKNSAITIGVENDGGMAISLMDSKGKLLAKFGVSFSNGVEYWLADTNGKQRVNVSFEPDGKLEFSLLDTKGLVRIVQRIREFVGRGAEQTIPELAFGASNGMERLSLCLEKELPVISMHNENNRTVMGLGTSNEGTGITLHDPQGRHRLAFGVKPDRSIEMAIISNSGNSTWLIVDGDDSDKLTLIDSSGAILFSKRLRARSRTSKSRKRPRKSNK